LIVVLNVQSNKRLNVKDGWTK